MRRKRCCIASETVHTPKTSGSSLASQIKFTFPKKLCVARLKLMLQVRFQPSSLLVSGGRGDTVTRCVLVMKLGPSLGFISTFKARLKWLRAPFIPWLLLIQTVWFVGTTETSVVLSSMWMEAAWELQLELDMVASYPELCWPLSLRFLELHCSNY